MEKINFLQSYDEILEKKVKFGKYHVFFVLVQGIYKLKLFIFIINLKGIFIFAFSNQIIITSLLSKFLKNYFKLSDLSSDLLGSSLFIGLAIGCLISGKLEKFLGRRKLLIATNFMLFICSTTLIFTEYITIFIAIKIISGILLGICEGMIYTTISEISPIKIRGALVNCIFIFFGLGYFFSTFICYLYLKSLTKGSGKIILSINVWKIFK